MPMRQGLKPENRTQSGVSLRFDGSRAASASVVPMRQPSRQLSGSFPFKLERMDSRHALALASAFSCKIENVYDGFQYPGFAKWWQEN